MQALEYIAGSEKVIEALGYWPTFHDAELISFQAERSIPVNAGYSVARFAIHVRQYETIGEGTASYEQVLRRSVLIRFALSEASDFELSGFNHQNVIS
jgi:Immunity protein 50